MAFALHKFAGPILPYDRRYVQWMARTWHYFDGVRVQKYYPLHPCTEEEMSKFFPPESEDTANEIEKLLEIQNLFCLHPSANDFYLLGSWLKNIDSTTYDIQINACASAYELFDGTVLGGEDDCIWDKEEVQAYLGTGFY